MTQPQPQPVSHWGAFALIMLGGIFGSFQLGKLPAAIPSMREELGLSLVAAGWILSLMALTGALFGVAMGAVADWLGHRRISISGLALAGAASIAGGLAEGQTGLLLFRFLEGLGLIFVFVAAPSLIIRAVAPAQVRLALGIWGGYMPIGMAAMVLLTPPLLVPFGWRGVWLVNGALLTLLSLAFAFGLRDLGAPAGVRRSKARLRTLGDDIWTTLRAPGPLLLGLAFAAHAANFLAVFAFLPTILIEQLGVGVGEAAGLTALGIVLNAGGNIAAGYLLQKGVPRWHLMVIANLVTAASSLVIYADGASPELRYAFCLVLSFGSGMLPASVIAGATVLAPRRDLVATTNGLAAQGANIGNLLGAPALAAVVGLAGGWHGAPWMICGLAGFGVVVSVALGMVERAKMAAAAEHR